MTRNDATATQYLPAIATLALDSYQIECEFLFRRGTGGAGYVNVSDVAAVALVTLAQLSVPHRHERKDRHSSLGGTLQRTPT